MTRHFAKTWSPCFAKGLAAALRVGVFIMPEERVKEPGVSRSSAGPSTTCGSASIGKIITSVGVSASIDMAPHVVRRLRGGEVARRTVRDLEYHWASEPEAGKRAV
jgi:hypothetical protein